MADFVRAHVRRALTIACDVADAAQVQRAYERIAAEFGAFRMLVSTVGAATRFQTLRELSPQEWARTIDIDLTGTFHVLRYGVEPIKQAGGGSIVVIGSIGAQMVPSRNAHGAAAKAGVEALVRVTAREEARNGIRANVVAIGITDTDMAKVALGSWGDEITQKVVKGIPLGRIGRPEDVANAVVFLLGEEGSYITGKVLQVDGGQLITG
jgi:NAD(P)-dependent dehydrogenase (short-subunit alcohol dehydrogenase family)